MVPGDHARRIAETLIAGGAPAFDPERLGAWLNAADWLTDRGELAAARAALETVEARQPGLEWVSNLLGLLDRTPAPEPQAADFHDDISKDFQVMARPGSQVALLLFCGARHRVGIHLPLIHRWLARLGVSLIYLRDFHGVCYLRGVASLGEDRPATIAALRRTLDELGAQRTICLGCSGGGFGAMLYALELGGDAVSMGSPVNMEPEFNRHMNHGAIADQLKAAFPDEDLDLRRRIEAAARPGRTLIVYGERNWNERIHAEQAAGLKGAELYPVTGYKGHATIPELIRRGELEPMLEAFLAGRPVRAMQAEGA